MNCANFFWSGPNFNFLEFIVLTSHLKVGHTVTVWLHGKSPNNKYWEMIEPRIIIKDADSIFNTSKFITNGGNFRTAADLWRFNFLYKYGGLYCDTDAFALREFPDDEWIVCSAETIPEMLSIGVLKAPPNHPMFIDCMNLTKNNWGNIQVFSSVYKKYFGHTNPTHKNELFYPYKWEDFMKLIRKVDIPMNAYSVHFYSNALEHYLPNPRSFFLRHFPLTQRLCIRDLNEEWCENHPATLLGKLWKWLLNEQPVFINAENKFMIEN